MPMPATCWLTPTVTVSSAIIAPATAPAASAQATPAQSDPVRSAARKPTKAPAYIVPSMPRLSTPARSLQIAPSAPNTSGVAIVNIAPIAASSEMFMRRPPGDRSHASARRPDDPVVAEHQHRDHGEQQDGRDEITDLVGNLQH